MEKIGYEKDMKVKLAHNIRCRTSRAFKSQNVEKVIKTFELLGCSQKFFKWIIHQLYDVMTIGNYGSVWCLDQCYPLGESNLSNEIVCWNLLHGLNKGPCI